MTSLPRVTALGLLFALPAWLAVADRAAVVQLYSAPEMNLAEVDRSILNQVGNGGQINFAAFIFTDYSIMDSLRNASEKGARVRIYLDPRELQRLTLSTDHPFVRLAHSRNVEIKVKALEEGLMHLKAYSVNGAIMRTGSANESFAGLERQDNDLVVISDKVVVSAFDRKFEAMWSRPKNMSFVAPY